MLQCVATFCWPLESLGLFGKREREGRKYGVATISRLLKIIRLFCRIPSLLQGSFAKETYNFKEPTNRSHPIGSFENKTGHLMEFTCLSSESFHECVVLYSGFLMQLENGQSILIITTDAYAYVCAHAHVHTSDESFVLNRVT